MTFFEYWREQVVKIHLVTLCIQAFTILALKWSRDEWIVWWVDLIPHVIILALGILFYSRHVRSLRRFALSATHEVTSLFPGVVRKVKYDHALNRIELWINEASPIYLTTYQQTLLLDLVVANTYWKHMGVLGSGRVLMHCNSADGCTYVSRSEGSLRKEARAAVVVIDINPTLAEHYVESGKPTIHEESAP